MRWPKSAYLPDIYLAKELIQRRLYERAKRREEVGFTRQWFLLHGPAPQESLLHPQPATLQKIYPPKDRIWADPFLWKHGADLFIFCEEWFYAKPFGEIAVMQLRKDGSVTPSQTILAKHHHLSYPFLFEHEGKLHMIPEGGGGRAIDVYECEEFPTRWRLKTTLMRDVEYVDATLFPHQKKWWLLATMKRGVFALNRDLFAFWADHPFATDWKPHPANPIVRGLTRARPAGRVFELNGKLYRPSQDCLIRYGYGLGLNEIVLLDEQHYQEKLITEVKPDWEAGIRANHHIDWHAGTLVMDTQRLIPNNEVIGR